MVNRPDKGNFTAPSKKRFLQSTNTTPDSIDWRDSGAVSSVKNQDTCGSCYGAMEGAYQIKTGTLVEFSTQQLLDCTSNTLYKNLGCVGGNMENTFTYLKTKKHMPASQYPYVNAQKNCSYVESKGLVNTAGFSYISKNNPDAIIEALQYGPVTAAVAADNQVFTFYSQGILNSSDCGTSINHAILIVGYGNDTEGTPFWTIKNTWGINWGEDGYIRIQRDLVAGGPGICGINTYVVMPILTQSVSLP